VPKYAVSLDPQIPDSAMLARVPIDQSLARRQAALRFLLDRIDYERMQSLPSSEEAFKLDRMRELLRRLGNPQDGLPIVHVAGTKGKGSTAAMVAAVLSAAGYRTGLFSSPHLDRVEERMAIDGRPCSADELVDLVEVVRPIVETLHREAERHDPPEQGSTYFELITAMALVHFVRRKVDAAVLEVGLGGRLDSTNVCRPMVSIITSISFDHTKQLGHTLAAIAAEKAGILKPGVPVVSGVTPDEPREVIRQIARRNDCRLVELGVDFDFAYDPARHVERAASPGHVDFRYGRDSDEAGKRLRYEHVALGLLGRHQAANAAVAMAALEELRETGWDIPEAAVRRGLAEVVWPARVEVVARRPTVVLDAAHNAASIAALIETLAESFSARRRLLIFATTQDKDLRGMLGHLLGQFDEVVFTRYLNNPRAVPPQELQALAMELSGRRYAICPEPADAWDAIHRLAGPDDLICITGSFFIAAEMRRQLASRPFPLAAEMAVHESA
jgi:dihydrofolate synthase/folylpolyglutamate synthase